MEADETITQQQPSFNFCPSTNSADIGIGVIENTLTMKPGISVQLPEPTEGELEMGFEGVLNNGQDINSQSCFICNQYISPNARKNEMKFYPSQNKNSLATWRPNSPTHLTEPPTPTTQFILNVSKYLCRLFCLEVDIYEQILCTEVYCQECQELFENISIIYEELEKLNDELNERKDFVEEQLRQSYKANQKKITTEESLSGAESLSSRLQLQNKIVNKTGKAFEAKKSQPSDGQLRKLQSCTNFHTKAIPAELVEVKVEPRDDFGEEGIEDWSFTPDTNGDLEFDPLAAVERLNQVKPESYNRSNAIPKEVNDTAMKKSSESEAKRSRRAKTTLQSRKYCEYFDADSSGEEFVLSGGQSDEDRLSDDEEFFESNSKSKKDPRRGRNSKAAFVCNHCGKQCNSASKLERHENSHSDEKKYNCVICEKPFKTKFAAINHEITHNKPIESDENSVLKKPYKCPVEGCPNDYFSQRGLRKHVNRFHKNFNASTGKDNPKRKARSVKAGSSNNNGSKSYKCRICGKSCKSPYDLNYHEESHKPNHERKHVCNVCGKGFFKQSVLNKHQIKHAPENQGALAGLSLCQTCGKYVTQLKTHMRSHSGEKLFPCKICGRSFGTRESVRVHSRIHTGEKPFDCSTCGMKFRTSQSYRRHTKVHESEKTFICDYCGKAFRLKQSLREHTHVHTKEAPYRCNICGKRFPQQILLSQHLNQDHTIEQIEKKKKKASNNGSRRKQREQTSPNTIQIQNECLPLPMPIPILTKQIQDINTNTSSTNNCGSPIGMVTTSSNSPILAVRPEEVEEPKPLIPTITQHQMHNSISLPNLTFIGHSQGNLAFPPYFPFTSAAPIPTPTVAQNNFQR